MTQVGNAPKRYHIFFADTGRAWQDKVSSLREKMVAKDAVALVLTALDDIAWLLNLRGSDIEFNPVFFSYLIITAKNVL